MTFKQLEYIVEIYSCGSMNKAARKLFVSQTAISSSIKQLENELGVKLFNRTTHGIKYTDDGIRFVSYAASLLSEKQRIESMYTGEPADDTMIFSVTSQRFLFVQDALLRLSNSEDASAFQITYREKNLNEVLDDVTSARSDVGIISISNLSRQFLMRQIDLSHLVFHTLATVTPSVFCRCDHPLTGKATVQESDLLPYPYLYYELPPGTPADFSEEYQMMSLKVPSRSFCTNSSSFACHAFIHSDAYTIGTGLSFASSKDNRQLTSIPFSGADPIEIGWISQPASQQSPITGQFIEQLKRALMDSMAQLNRSLVVVS